MTAKKFAAVVAWCATLATARAGGCLPLVMCPSAFENLGSVANEGSASQRMSSCPLEDGSDGVMCQTPAMQLSTRFNVRNEGKASTAILFPQHSTNGESTKNDAENLDQIANVEPLRNRLREDEHFEILGDIEPQEILSSENISSIVFPQLSSRFGRPSNSERLQELFSQPQDQLSSDIGLRSLQQIKGLQDLRNRELLRTRFNFKSSPSSSSSSRDDLIEPTGSSRAQSAATAVRTVPSCRRREAPVCEGDQSVRSFDGTCNNLAASRRGAAHTGFARLFPAAYEDRVWEPRQRSAATGGPPLPSPRLISASTVTTSVTSDSRFTLSLMLLGQLVSHDLLSTLTLPRVACCLPGGQFPARSLNAVSCHPIRVASDDPLYGRLNKTCLSQIRSFGAEFEDCVAGPASQQNQVTHYLDASIVYGSSVRRAGQLRSTSSHNDGSLATGPGNTLPRVNGDLTAGEGRFGENAGLAVMHTVWLREHNRLAAELRARHADWSGNAVFERARRLLTAEWQHIIYNEWLPAVLGGRFARQHALWIWPEDGSQPRLNYSSSVDARVSTEFSTAAFRFGHSQVGDVFALQSAADGAARRLLPLSQTFFNSTPLQSAEFVGAMVGAAVNQRPPLSDHGFAETVRGRLFGDQDLVALNINRGRDHGLPGYVVALQNCARRQLVPAGGNMTERQRVAALWRALTDFMPAAAVASLRRVYQHPADVDLYIGGMLERPAQHSLLGPTFQCIVAQQFFNSRYGDRLFYDNGGQPGSFSEQQLSQLHRTSWARVLCDNVPELRSVQPLALWQPTMRVNRPRRCDSAAIPRVDLSFF